MQRLFFLGILVTLLPATPARAQADRPQLIVNQPLEKPVTLEKLRIQVQITGILASTSMEMTFFNPNDRVLEGTLQFPLLEGQTVVRFAMDVDGKLRDAVPVEQAAGQQIFEEIERRKIDPGLIEKTQGNNYRARVYPVPAQGRKRILVAVLEEILPKREKQIYRLPLQFENQLREFAFKIQVQGAETKPVITQNTIPGLDLPDWTEQFSTKIEKTDFRANGLLEITIPSLLRPRIFTETRGNNTYFYAEVPAPSISRRRPTPRIIGLLWDSSASGAERDHEREFQFLDAYFKKVPFVEVRLIRLRDAPETSQSGKVTSGNWLELRRELENTIYDGATNLASIPSDPAVEEYILFSDGLSNFGSTRIPGIQVPVHAILSAVRSDPAYLQYLAAKTNGTFINLISESPSTAANHLLNSASRLLAVEAHPEELAQVFPEAPKPVQGIFSVAGVLRIAEAKIRLRFGFPGNVGTPVDLVVRKDENKSPLAALAWARLKIACLEHDYDQNKGDIRRTAQEFGLATHGTSLIVLDRVEDYVEYGITPPEDLREWYDALHRESVQQREKNTKDHVDKVAELFEEKVNWWKKDFPKDLPARKEQKEKLQPVQPPPRSDSVAGDIRPPVPESSPSPPPAMPPTPPEAMEAPAAESALTVLGEKLQVLPGEGSAGVSIRLQKWTPDAGYLDHFKRVPKEKLYDAYLSEKPDYLKSTAFYLDAADFFLEASMTDLAIRILSNLAEMDLENYQILRILGYRLLQLRKPDLALPIFEKVLELRPGEPQSYRDLALACAAEGEHQRAIDLLAEVINKPWDERFPEVELIALSELNSIAETSGQSLDLSKIDARLRKNLPLDLRVVLTWDADNTDIDLWVTDPNGEKCFYENRNTYQGGRMSTDFTQGYGPEEFSLHFAKPGKYVVEANFYGNRQQIISGATTIQLTMSSKFGTMKQQDQTITLRLKDVKEVVKVGEFEVK